MKQKSLGLLLVLIGCTFLSRAQENHAPTDTAVINTQVYIPALPFYRPDLSLPPSLKLMTSNYSPEYLHASLTAPPSLTEKATKDLQSIWQHELAIENDGKTWRTILSSIQMGGVAYILYEHVHKYGLK